MGHLDKRWEDWFGGMSIHHLNTGESVLSGPVVDQSELYGIIRRISGLNLILLYLERENLNRPAKPAGDNAGH